MRRFAQIFIILAGLLTIVPVAAAATATENSGLILECDRVRLDASGKVISTDEERCGIDDFVAQFVRLAQWGITIVVFIAVMMLVYGGFEFITAGGRQAKIQSGQNIITGTIIGLAISMSAYVIINFTVGAITGTKTSANPLTAISTVFGSQKQQEEGLTQTFSGTSDSSTTPACRSVWDNTCSNQVLCADPVDDNLTGQIATAQARLRSFGCECVVDGCFGKNTAQCVRRFQIANNLVPTGTLDEVTSNTLQLASPELCSGTNATRVTAVLKNLPATTTSGNVKDANADSVGCCVVQKPQASGAVPLYCINDISERGCAALGADYIYANGKDCSEDAKTIPLCGYCTNSSERCLQQVGKYWCEQAIKNITGAAMTFKTGICTGGTEFCNLNGPSCANALAL